MFGPYPRHWCQVCGEPVRREDYEQHFALYHADVRQVARSAQKRLSALVLLGFGASAAGIAFGVVEGGRWGSTLALGALVAVAVYGLVVYRVTMHPVEKAVQEVRFRCLICDTKVAREAFHAHVLRTHGDEKNLFRIPGSFTLGAASYLLVAGFIWVAATLFGFLSPSGRMLLAISALCVAVATVGIGSYVVFCYLPRRIAKARAQFRQSDIE